MAYFDNITELGKKVILPVVHHARERGSTAQAAQLEHLFKGFKLRSQICVLLCPQADEGITVSIRRFQHIFNNDRSLNVLISMMQKLNKELCEQYANTKPSSQYLCTYIPAAMFWINLFNGHLEMDIRCRKETFVKAIRRHWEKQLVKREKKIEHAEVILDQTCDFESTNFNAQFITVHNFVRFLHRFGPLEKSFEKARAVCCQYNIRSRTSHDHRFQTKQRWWWPNVPGERVKQTVEKYDLTDQWLLRYSANQPECLTWAFLTKAGDGRPKIDQIRIHNSDAGYYLGRYKEKEMKNRHKTVVQAMQTEFELIHPHTRTIQNSLDWWDRVYPLEDEQKVSHNEHVPPSTDPGHKYVDSAAVASSAQSSAKSSAQSIKLHYQKTIPGDGRAGTGGAGRGSGGAGATSSDHVQRNYVLQVKKSGSAVSADKHPPPAFISSSDICPNLQQHLEQISEALNPDGDYIPNKNLTTNEDFPVPIDQYSEVDVVYLIKGFDFVTKANVARYAKAFDRVNGKRLLSMTQRDFNDRIQNKDHAAIIYRWMREYKRAYENGDEGFLS